ncbi:MAG: DUF424 domain-containing protein [Methanobacteriota archaeon]
MTNICAKVYRRGKETLLAASDADLVGRTVTDGRVKIQVSEDFYGREPVSEADFVRELGLCTIANLIGVRVVDIAIEAGFVLSENVLWVDGVPHAQAALLR